MLEQLCARGEFDYDNSSHIGVMFSFLYMGSTPYPYMHAYTQSSKKCLGFLSGIRSHIHEYIIKAMSDLYIWEAVKHIFESRESHSIWGQIHIWKYTPTSTLKINTVNIGKYTYLKNDLDRYLG